MNTISRLILYSLLLFSFTAALAQSTTVTATVVDQSSVVWANGSYTLQFVPNPQAQGNPTWNGNPFPNTQWTYPGVLDNAGHFSTSVPSNNFIAPAGSTYTATICSNTSAPCVVIPRLTFQGTSQDISSTITNAAVPFTIQAQSIPRAYTDAEMAVQTSQAGYLYQNVTSQSPRYWDGSFWSPFAGTVTSVALGNLNPLFTTNNSGTGTAPAFNFTAENAFANSVYANCTTSSALPTFCGINAGMLPATINSNTTGNAQSSNTTIQFVTTPLLCTGSQFAKGIGALGNASCFTINFTDLTGNINVGQMNNGLNANATRWWRGDGSWQPLPTIPNIQSASAAGCFTGSSSFSTCNVTVTWPVAFADSGYQAVCTGNSPNDARAYITGNFAKTASSIQVQTATAGSVAVSYGNIDCIAIHP